VRGLVASLLRRLDYEVAEAADGPQAIRLSSERPFRLLLTDIALRGTDGRDLARAICDGGRTDAPRVLYMSGHALSDSCRPCLPKPFSARMLAEGVRLALA
jgi:CheY-like chemotaxis protein